ncbi:hypothetical protein ACFSCW_12015 [Sphingomonas tabacisoli]|uniref:Uncharacterized protein n=1 Tax=Sphingomonas tabacisoli TaxID=2249466 RepID=A0ABW4I4V5_9SPHN
MTESRFIAVSTPSRTEGVGRALQVAFRDGFELPAEMRAALDKLEAISL